MHCSIDDHIEQIRTIRELEGLKADLDAEIHRRRLAYAAGVCWYCPATLDNNKCKHAEHIANKGIE